MGQGLPTIISWDDAWKIGVAEIDEHHQTLVKLVQKLFGALITAQGADYVKEIVVQLIDYTKYHFQKEEEIFTKHGFDQLEAHKAKHQELIKQVLDVSQDILKEGTSEDLSEDVYHFMKHWLVDHIINEDLKFKTFLEKKA